MRMFTTNEGEARIKVVGMGEVSMRSLIMRHGPAKNSGKGKSRSSKGLDKGVGVEGPLVVAFRPTGWTYKATAPQKPYPLKASRSIRQQTSTSPQLDHAKVSDYFTSAVQVSGDPVEKLVKQESGAGESESNPFTWLTEVASMQARCEYISLYHHFPAWLDQMVLLN